MAIKHRDARVRILMDGVDQGDVKVTEFSYQYELTDDDSHHMGEERPDLDQEFEGGSGSITIEQIRQSVVEPMVRTYMAAVRARDPRPEVTIIMTKRYPGQATIVKRFLDCTIMPEERSSMRQRLTHTIRFRAADVEDA